MASNQPQIPNAPASNFDILKEIDQLTRTLEITRSARFAASKRLGDRHRASMYVISSLSTGVILLSLIPNCVKINSSQNQIILACSIIISVFIIFTSIIDSGSEFHYRSITLLRSGRDIDKVLRDLHVRKNKGLSLIKTHEDIQREYQNALNECPENHDDVDYLRIKIYRPALFNNLYSDNRFYSFIQYNYDVMRYYIRVYSWLIPPVTLSIIVFLIVNYKIIS